MKLSEILGRHAEGMRGILTSIAVIDGGKDNIEKFSYDGKSLYRGAPDRVYEIGSITKTFTASLICKLADRGEIELDNSIARYIDGCDDGYFYPTVRQILTHTGGYTNDIECATEAGDAALTARVANFGGDNELDCIYKYILDEDIIENVHARKLEHKEYPYSYSNIGFATLGSVISRATKRPYSELMTEFIENDLGLLNTTVDIPASDNVMRGVTADNKDGGNWIWKQSGALAAGSLYSTLDDLVRYINIYKSRVPSYLGTAHDKAFAVSEENGFSIGLSWIKSGDITWHNGGTGCFRSFAGFREDCYRGVVVLENCRERNDISVDTIGFGILNGDIDIDA